jgi:hypothetical protein
LQVATAIATVLPLWESRQALVNVLVASITCKKADPDAMEDFGKIMGKPAIPRVPGANPFRTPDSTVHNPKEQDVEMGKKDGETKP